MHFFFPLWQPLQQFFSLLLVPHHSLFTISDLSWWSENIYTPTLEFLLLSSSAILASLKPSALSIQSPMMSPPSQDAPFSPPSAVSGYPPMPAYPPPTNLYQQYPSAPVAEYSPLPSQLHHPLPAAPVPYRAPSLSGSATGAVEKEQRIQASLYMPVLPGDIMARILRMAIQGLSPASRYRILRAAALVSRSWQLPAQTLLFRDVVIHSQPTANKWIKSPANERFIAERIEIDGRYGQVDYFGAEAVLMKAPLGVKRLRIDFVRGLSSRALCLPNLASVTHLTLHTKVLCDATPVYVHFQLTRLVLGGTYFPLAFTKALFASSVDSLTDLSITMQAGQSPALRELVNQSIGTLNRLTTLSDWCRTSQEFIDLVPHLPLSLETLNSCFPDRHRMLSLYRAFSLPALPHLTSFRLMYLTSEDVMASVDGIKLRSECENRGVAVTFGFEKDYLREEHLLSRTEALKIYY